MRQTYIHDCVVQVLPDLCHENLDSLMQSLDVDLLHEALEEDSHTRGAHRVEGTEERQAELQHEGRKLVSLAGQRQQRAAQVVAQQVIQTRQACQQLLRRG